MSTYEWPDGVTFRALGEWWPSARTLPADRTKSAFAAKWNSTVLDFEREIRMYPLGVHEWRLYLDINPRNITKTGRIREAARVESPGIVVEIETPNDGSNVYAADRFLSWRENFRAITLALEALRAVDRYGLNDTGRQYTGFRAIESGIALGSSPFTTADQARDYLAGVLYDLGKYSATLDDRALVMRALRVTHPDQGGNPAVFTKVGHAADAIKREQTP